MDSFGISYFLLIFSINISQYAEKDIVISTIKEPRFVKLKDGVYSGFIPELIAQLSDLANFNYTLRLVKDGKDDGKNNRRKLRNFAVEELIDHDTDMIATTLSMSKARKKLVDFSVPFDKHGITALFKRPPVGMPSPFETYEDLLYQKEYVFGTVIRSSIDKFFGRTGESPYWEMGGYMDMYDEYMVDNVKQGLEYVRSTDLRIRNTNIKYLFLVDSTIADNLIHKYPCDLVTFNKTIRHKGYGFAYRKGDALLRYKIDDALRLLIRNGTLVKLKQKWWKDSKRCDWESRYYYY